MPKVKLITHKSVGEACPYNLKVKEMTESKVKEFFEKHEIKSVILRDIHAKQIKESKLEKAKVKNG